MLLSPFFRSVLSLAQVVGIASLLAQNVFGNVQMPSVFGDHMVLQASAKDAFWGTASPDEQITVTVGSATAVTQAGSDGKWKVLVDVPAASTTPISVTVHGQNTLTFQDVLLGEVWLASGQSNMEMGLRQLKNGAEEIAKGDHPLIHVLTVPFSSSFAIMENLPPPTVQDKQGSSWQVCSPQVLQADGWNGVSGVADYFGREIQEKTGHPVGIIVAAYHGQSAQGFISLAALKADPALSRYVDDLNVKTQKADTDKASFPQSKAAYDQQMAQWDQQYGADYKKALDAWNAEKTAAVKNGQPIPPAPPLPAPRPKSPPDGSPGLNVPTTSYNAMIHPLIPYGIRGVIWYQGESNAGYPWDYDYLMGQLIKDWRTEWGRDDFPFISVQLCTLGKESFFPGFHGGWPLIREMQTRTQSIPNTGLAVTIDLGDGGLHPGDKQDVGHRLALSARNLVYGESVEDFGPTYDSMTLEGNKIRLGFKHASGLKLASHPPLVDANQVTPLEIPGFAIAGEDKVWNKAQARIEGETVVVWNDQITKPVAVRYGWGNAPACYLYNAADLPMGPFRTDVWDEHPFVKTDQATVQP
jgi:sialate O-acetylesterase